MGLRDLFSGKQEDAGEAQAVAGDVVLESTYLKAALAGGIVHATVLTEKVTEREARILQEELVQAVDASGHKLSVDLSSVMMLASAGIGAFVQVHRACEGNKGKMVLHSIDAPILEMLKISRMDKLFTIVPDRATALRKLG
ncbi:MAG: STAS domain-containing protein [Planctomycetota bacterium]